MAVNRVRLRSPATLVNATQFTSPAVPAYMAIAVNYLLAASDANVLSGAPTPEVSEDGTTWQAVGTGTIVTASGTLTGALTGGLWLAVTGNTNGNTGQPFRMPWKFHRVRATAGGTSIANFECSVAVVHDPSDISAWDFKSFYALAQP